MIFSDTIKWIDKDQWKRNRNNNISLISNEYQNNRLNSPNDVCVHSNGTIFFTDPPYGIINQKRTEGFPGAIMYGGCYVFKCCPPSRELIAIITDMDRPNGIAFSLNEKKLYIDQPDYAFLLSWHISEELKNNLRNKGYKGKFIIPLPKS